MVYEQKYFIELEIMVNKYRKKYKAADNLIGRWMNSCEILYNLEKSDMYLKYADARKQLAELLQDNLILFNEDERYPVCDLILGLLKFSDCSDEKSWTKVQRFSWYINKMIKKYDFNYWEVMLRHIGEDETDIVRKIYSYINKLVNRIEVIDTFYEYLEEKNMDESEKAEMNNFIKEFENFTSDEWK